ncbi:MAG: hypothetical protein NXI04_11500 [Planctomycetaceae bacterium]|nr:hypothetical protein [Planctomycetaceae bacterium]
MQILSLIAGIWLLAIVFQTVPPLKQTEMRTAALWARGFSLMMLAACVAQLFPGASEFWPSLLCWSTAVLGLTPFVDVLGARRPQHQAWPLFVVGPMVLVFHWPAIAQLAASGTQAAIEIPGPFAIGYVLVVLMGCGNYFGTANTMSAILAGTGLLLVQLPLTTATDAGSTWQLMGPILLALAAALATPPSSESESTSQGANQLWTDFCDLFGMVWAKRVMDRVNQFAERESWSVRLSLFGFVASRDPQTDPVAPDARATIVMCWVLRRFLDQEFMSRYVPSEQIRDSLTQENG